ncbi:MAG: D-amino acid aminotransferase [Phycisphaera sp.]|nr:D-amino acid aminotransferase [Phycisphaera sp.]
MLIHLNGSLVDEADARISVLDRGFLFGDGVYELVRFFAGHGVGMDAHVARLAKSLALARIEGFDAGDVPTLCAELLAANALEDAVVYLQVTRGAGQTRAHVPQERLRPTVMAMASAAEPLSALVAPQEIAAITAEDLRWRRCEIKTLSLMGNILHLLDASDAGAQEAILHRGGIVGEGAYSNVAIVSGGVLATPPVDADPPILHGTARIDLLDAARDAGVRAEVRAITLDELHRADEILITSSRRLASSVVKLDGRPVGCGHAGPVARTLFAAMREAIAQRRVPASAAR